MSNVLVERITILGSRYASAPKAVLYREGFLTTRHHFPCLETQTVMYSFYTTDSAMLTLKCLS